MIFKVRIDVFDTNVWFLVDVSNRKFKNFCTKNNLQIDNLERSQAHAYADRHENNIVVRFNEPPLANPGLVSHEIQHAALYVYEIIGIKYTPETEEFLAWIVEYLTTQFYNKVQ